MALSASGNRGRYGVEQKTESSSSQAKPTRAEIKEARHSQSSPSTPQAKPTRAEIPEARPSSNSSSSRSSSSSSSRRHRSYKSTPQAKPTRAEIPEARPSSSDTREEARARQEAERPKPKVEQKTQVTHKPTEAEINKEFRSLLAQGKSPEEASRIISQKYGASVQIKKAQVEVIAPTITTRAEEAKPEKKNVIQQAWEGYEKGLTRIATAFEREADKHLAFERYEPTLREGTVPHHLFMEWKPQPGQPRTPSELIYRSHEKELKEYETAAEEYNAIVEKYRQRGLIKEGKFIGSPEEYAQFKREVQPYEETLEKHRPLVERYAAFAEIEKKVGGVYKPKYEPVREFLLGATVDTALALPSLPLFAAALVTKPKETAEEMGKFIMEHPHRFAGQIVGTTLLTTGASKVLGGPVSKAKAITEQRIGKITGSFIETPGIKFVESFTWDPATADVLVKQLAGKKATLVHMTEHPAFDVKLSTEILLEGKPELAANIRRAWDALHWYQSAPSSKGEPLGYLSYVGIGKEMSESIRFTFLRPKVQAIITRDVIEYIKPRKRESFEQYQVRTGQMSGKTMIPGENVFGYALERQVITPAKFKSSIMEGLEYPGTKLIKKRDIGWTHYKQTSEFPEIVERTKLSKILRKLGYGEKYHKIHLSEWEKRPVETASKEAARPGKGARSRSRTLELTKYYEEYGRVRYVSLSEVASKALSYSAPLLSSASHSMSRMRRSEGRFISEAERVMGGYSGGYSGGSKPSKPTPPHLPVYPNILVPSESSVPLIYSPYRPQEYAPEPYAPPSTPTYTPTTEYAQNIGRMLTAPISHGKSDVFGAFKRLFYGGGRKRNPVAESPFEVVFKEDPFFREFMGGGKKGRGGRR